MLRRFAEVTMDHTKSTTPPGKNATSKPAMPIANAKPTANENEGEGSKTAARHYNDAAEKFTRSGQVEPAANAAKEALEGPEGDELREAEEDARETEPEPERASKH
jgi:hypothetical protein